MPPDCEIDGGDGCKIYIDRLGLRERHVLQVYSALMTAGEIVGPEIILKRHEVTCEEFDLIIALIDERNKIEGEKNGNGKKPSIS